MAPFLLTNYTNGRGNLISKCSALSVLWSTRARTLSYIMFIEKKSDCESGKTN